jgi:hypothetical protein
MAEVAVIVDPELRLVLAHRLVSADHTLGFDGHEYLLQAGSVWSDLPGL